MPIFIIDTTVIFCGSNQSKFGTYILLMLILAVSTFVFANSIEANILTPSIAYGKNKASSTPLSTFHKTKIHGVRITSPVSGQDVPVGKN
ncbi:MAG: hypothetical protein WAM14_04695, partial [Candidatus Nitrosopolaris sp.]